MNRKQDASIPFTAEELADADINEVAGGYAVDIDYVSYRFKHGDIGWTTAHTIMSPTSEKGKQLQRALSDYRKRMRV